MKNKNKKNNNQDRSPIIPQNPKIKNMLSIYRRELSNRQNEFMELALDKSTKMIFISGPAGSSKTYVSVLASLILMNEKRVSDLLYIRGAVECSEKSLGFLPGDAAEKLKPYMVPLLDKLDELLPRSEVDMLEKERRINSIPIGFLRGLNWNAKAIILDEAQNCTKREIITTITRVGEFSKVFVLGDPDQSDINGKSGFADIVNRFDDRESRENGIFVFKFTEQDIVRSAMCAFLVKKLKTVIN